MQSLTRLFCDVDDFCKTFVPQTHFFLGNERFTAEIESLTGRRMTTKNGASCKLAEGKSK